MKRNLIAFALVVTVTVISAYQSHGDGAQRPTAKKRRFHHSVVDVVNVDLP